MIDQRYGTIPLAAAQGTSLNKDGTRWFYFYCLVGPGKYQDTKVVVEDGEGYDSIDKALASIPLTKAKTTDAMRVFVARDFGMELGKVYEDFNIVAYVGSYHTTKPLAWYIYNGETKYIKHPQIELMVQRYAPEGDANEAS